MRLPAAGSAPGPRAFAPLMHPDRKAPSDRDRVESHHDVSMQHFAWHGGRQRPSAPFGISRPRDPGEPPGADREIAGNAGGSSEKPPHTVAHEERHGEQA